MTHNAEQAAADIVALINSRVQSPTKAEIEAIIVKHQLFGNLLRQRLPMAPDPVESPQREHWRTLIAESDAACNVSAAFLPDDPRREAHETAEAATKTAMDRVADFHQALWAEPPRDVDITLLAEVCFAEFWPGADLVGPESDALLQEGPFHETAASDKALAALLKAIHAQCLGGDLRRPPAS